MLAAKLMQIVLVSGAILSLSSAYGVAIPIVSIEPPSQKAEPGQSLSVDVLISDVADLYAFEFDLVFDPAILAAAGVTEGSFLPNSGTTVFIPGIIDNSGGTISAIADSLIGPIPGVTGTGTLATVLFDALAPGTGTLSLSSVILLSSTLALIDSSTVNGTVNVQPAEVAEPASCALLSTAFLGVVALSWGWRWRRRDRSWTSNRRRPVVKGSL
jgi:hypothetical protein